MAQIYKKSRSDYKLTEIVSQTLKKTVKHNCNDTITFKDILKVKWSNISIVVLTKMVVKKFIVTSNVYIIIQGIMCNLQVEFKWINGVIYWMLTCNKMEHYNIIVNTNTPIVLLKRKCKCQNNLLQQQRKFIFHK